MKVGEFLSLVGKQLIIRYPDIEGNYYASFDHGEVKDGGFLRSVSGRGPTAEAAIKDYLRRVSGKCVVFGGNTDRRKEINIQELTYE